MRKRDFSPRDSQGTVSLYKSLLGVLPYIGFSDICVAKGYQWFLAALWSEIGYQFGPFWSEIE